jgi:hypothetical protein
MPGRSRERLRASSRWRLRDPQSPRVRRQSACGGRTRRRASPARAGPRLVLLHVRERVDHDCARAEAEARRAFELEPTNPLVLVRIQTYSRMLVNGVVISGQAAVSPVPMACLEWALGGQFRRGIGRASSLSVRASSAPAQPRDTKCRLSSLGWTLQSSAVKPLRALASASLRGLCVPTAAMCHSLNRAAVVQCDFLTCQLSGQRSTIPGSSELGTLLPPREWGGGRSSRAR